MKTNDDTKTNQVFDQRLVKTLDQSLDTLSDSTLAELAQARAKAFNTHSVLPDTTQVPGYRFYRYGIPAIAASVFVAVMATSLFNKSSTLNSISLEDEITLSYLDVDPEMLEVMDLLIDLGALGEDTTDAI